MEITVLHGQAHKGSTYHITAMVIEKLTGGNAAVHEFFMPKDTPDFCVGCYQCIQKGEEFCPQADKVQKIVSSMLRSDIIIVDSPAYCMEMTGQLKTLFDHLAYMWMPHRPRKEMFSKIGIVISTTAGAGAGRVTKSIAKQLFYWGVPTVYRIPFSVNASCWAEVPEKVKKKITRKTQVISRRAKNQTGNVKPNSKTRLFFTMMRNMQKINDWCKPEHEYWQENNWLEKARPWK